MRIVMSRYLTIGVLSLVPFVLCTVAQSKVFVAPMEGNFDTFVTAAMISKKVPVTVVTDEAAADYIITGVAVKGDHKWSDTVFGNPKDRNQGSLKVINPKDKSIVFAASAGDKSFWFDGIKRTGQRKVAERLADKLKDFFKKNKPAGA